MGKHALLFAGWVNTESEKKRYRNNIGFMYKVLIEKLGFENNNIEVLFINGPTIRYGRHNIATRKASKEAFIQKLASYQTLSKEDQLFVFITNHGGLDQRKKRAYIYTYSYKTVDQMEFVNELNKIVAPKIIVMGQCYGGNILEVPIRNATVISATSKNQESMSRPYINGKAKVYYDEFLYHFISYYNGKYPDGKRLNLMTYEDKTIKAAFEYAKLNDYWYTRRPVINKTICCEDPCIKINSTIELIGE